MERAQEAMAVLGRGVHTYGLDWVVIMKQTEKALRIPKVYLRRKGGGQVPWKRWHMTLKPGRREDGTHSRWGRVGEQQKAKSQQQEYSGCHKDQ